MDSQNTHTVSSYPSAKRVLVIVGVMLITLLAGDALFDNLRAGVRQEAERNIIAVGSLKSNQVHEWLDDRLSDARTLSDNSYFVREASRWIKGGAKDGAMRKQLIQHLEAFMNGHHFRSMVLYDASGRALLSAGKPLPENGELDDMARQVALSGYPEFIDLHRHQDGSLPVGLGFMNPLREGKAVFGSLYQAEDPADYLFPIISQWASASKTAETLLVRVEGDNILYLSPLRHRRVEKIDFRLPLNTPRLAASGEIGLLSDVLDYRGESVLAYVSAIKGTSWRLVSKIDENEAYRVVDQVRRVAGILAIFIFALFGAVVWQWRRREQEAMESAILKERVRADFLQMEGAKRFRMVFEHTSLPMVRNALNGEFIEVNEAWCSMFGYSPEETYSQHLSWQKLTHPEDLDSGSVLVKKLLAGEIDKFHVEKRYLHKDGRILWGILQVTLVHDDQGKAQYFISAIQDITERKQLERALQDNLSILKMALEGAQEAVWEWDMVTGKTKFSPQYYTMLGYQPDEFNANQEEWFARIHPDERDAVIAKIMAELSQNQEVYVTECRMRAKDGRYRWIQGRGKVVAYDETGKPTRMVGINTDITERKQSEQQISFMAYHDKLTGLPNRALLFDRLAQAISQAKRDRKYVALMFVDLDGFKAVNDEYGHEAGDAVLKMAAQRFLACVRAVDTVARFGGDEFAIILGNLDAPDQVKGVAEKIVQAFGQSIALSDGSECTVGASVGISVYPDHGSAMDSLMTAADRAMYESKRCGKNTYTFFQDARIGSEMPWIRFESQHLVGIEEIDEQHRNLVYLVNRLNEALKHDESKEATMLMFDELLVATTHHFDTESRYMALYHYPEQKVHEVEHENLVREAMQLKVQFKEGRELLALQSIKDWLLGHIVYSDKKMAAYLQQQGMT